MSFNPYGVLVNASKERVGPLMKINDLIIIKDTSSSLPIVPGHFTKRAFVWWSWFARLGQSGETPGSYRRLSGGLVGR